MKKLLIAAVVIGLSAISTVALAADADAGKAKYAVCAGCHGATGAGNEALKYPKLAGLETAYFVEQMNAFKSGKRDNATMKAMVAGLSDADIANIAAYTATFK